MIASEASPRSGPAAAGEASAPASGGWLTRLGHFVFRRRKLLFPLVFIPVTLATTRRMLVGGADLDRWLDVAGFGAAILGQLLRALAIGLVYIKRGGDSGRIYATKLVHEGFFAHSRNPLYLGNLLIVFGMFLVLNSLPGYLLGLPFFVIAYLSLVLAEEDYLRRTFGKEYEDYHGRVNRFIPSPRGLWTTLTSMKFNWQRLVRKEYGATFAGGTWLLILLGWTRVVRDGFPQARATLEAALAVWVVLLLGYLTARFLKKTKRLGST